MDKQVVLKEPLPFEFKNQHKVACLVMFLIGAAGFVLTLFSDAQRAWQAYLMAFFLVTSISLSSLFFLI